MEKHVSVITCTIREENLDNVIDNYKRQTYPNKELIIIINKDDIDIAKYIEKAKYDKSIRVYKVYEEVTLGECLNIGTYNANYDYLTKFDDDDYYAPNYLKEIMEGFEKSNARVLGKQTFMIYFEKSRILFKKLRKSHQFTNFVTGSTLSWTRELWNEIKFRDIPHDIDDMFCLDCYEKGFESYSIGCSNHLAIRHQDKSEHTWTDSDEVVMSWGGEIILEDATLEMAIQEITD